MKCPHCGYENIENKTICNLCGNLMTEKKTIKRRKLVEGLSSTGSLVKYKKCIKYGHINKGTNIFCGKCGSELVPIEEDPAVLGFDPRPERANPVEYFSLAIGLGMVFTFVLGIAFGFYIL